MPRKKKHLVLFLVEEAFTLDLTKLKENFLYIIIQKICLFIHRHKQKISYFEIIVITSACFLQHSESTTVLNLLSHVVFLLDTVAVVNSYVQQMQL